eukprot:CCRYP_008454-RA/>CCRYP_008454-RA protein AED:0.37 eAED:0.64 QI:0/0/0/1/0/0/3/0/126
MKLSLDPSMVVSWSLAVMVFVDGRIIHEEIVSWGCFATFGESDFDVLKCWAPASVLDVRNDVSPEDVVDDHADCIHGSKKENGLENSVLFINELSGGKQRAITFWSEAISLCPKKRNTIKCSNDDS